MLKKKKEGQTPLSSSLNDEHSDKNQGSLAPSS
jgi:hypothetical protein